MNNIKAIIIGCAAIYSVLASYFIIIVSFWSLEYLVAINWLSYIMAALIVVFGGYIATSLSTQKKWWFGSALGISAYLILLIILNLYNHYAQGQYFVVVNIGTFNAAILMVLTSTVGGVIYKMKNRQP